MTAKCLMATFCLAKMKEKTYMFNEKNAIDQGILATSKTLAVSNAMNQTSTLLDVMAVSSVVRMRTAETLQYSIFDLQNF